MSSDPDTIQTFLTPDYIRQQLDLWRSLLEASWKYWPPKPGEADLFRMRQTNDLMRIASLEYAGSAPATTVRSLYREAAAIWEPVIASLDFSPRTFEGVTNSAKEAERYVEQFDANVENRGGEFRYRYVTVPEHFLTQFADALIAAAISGDLALAQRLAKAYPTPPVTRGWFSVLRHVLAGDMTAASIACQSLKPGYSSDWPPALIEFPQGVVLADPALLVKGLKTLNTRMKGMWGEKKWRTRHEKLKAGAIKRFSRRSAPTWDEMLRGVRDHLVAMRWILGEHALAFLNVASCRGMTSPFDQPKRFSQWVPLSLARPLDN